MTQLHKPVSTMPTTSMTMRATAMLEIPSHVVTTRKAIRAMNAETMKTSPWEKFTMPMMPNTMV